MQDQYTENYKPLLREFEDQNKWRGIFCSSLENYVGFNMSLLPKSISRFNTIPVKISAGFFVKIDKLILKFICRIAKGEKKKFEKKKNPKFGGLILPLFKTHSCYSDQDSIILVSRRIDQRNRIGTWDTDHTSMVNFISTHRVWHLRDIWSRYLGHKPPDHLSASV